MNYPTDRAFALMAFHLECHPHRALERASQGYVAQEVRRLDKLKIANP